MEVLAVSEASLGQDQGQDQVSTLDSCHFQNVEIFSTC
jgi:hypothetical protein